VAWARTAIMGVPTVVQAKTFVALDVHVSGTVAAMIDRDSGELWRRRLSGRAVEVAEFVAGLDVSRVARVFRKGTDREIDSYSGFYDNGHRRSTGMGEWLSECGVHDVYVMGLATDYCVKFTALDARKLGLDVTLIEDGCRGVELKAGDVARAVDEMRGAGVQVVQSAEI